MQTIADVLALAGASEAVLLFEEGAVMAATRSRANRLANADHANLVRTSRAAHEQLQAVAVLRRSGQFAELPVRLQEIAELRERHPTLSLRELAQKCRPPMTKAAVHRRLRKLQELASI
jgi:DNA-binding protein WhiA